MTWKTPLVRLFRGLGWHLSNDGLVRLDAPGGYLPSPPSGYRVYAPWTQPPFATLFQSIRPWTLVRDDRCYTLQPFARHCAHLPGDFAECGVYTLRFFYPQMVEGAVFIGDDYGFLRYKDAAKKAVDEFVADKPEPVIVLKTGQCIVIKH